MQQVSLTIEEVRAAGVAVPVSSRSYTLWINKLAPVLVRKGVTQTAIDRGRSACHVQHLDNGYLLKFHDIDDGVKRDAAQRSAAAALMEDQQRLLGKKTGNLPTAAEPFSLPIPPNCVAIEASELDRSALPAKPAAPAKAKTPPPKASARAARA